MDEQMSTYFENIIKKNKIMILELVTIRHPSYSSDIVPSDTIFLDHYKIILMENF